jgi:predicted Rossmann fold flavoprotein
MKKTDTTAQIVGLDTYDLIVIGGGAAGFFGALRAAEFDRSLRVVILENGPRFLTKVQISGGGRCNVTHGIYEQKKLIENYPRGRKELLGPLFRFQPKDTFEWFNTRGVELKTECDGRVFPITDSSKTIIDCFLSEAQRLNIKLSPRTAVTNLQKYDDRFIVTTPNGEVSGRNILLATGSSPTGHKLAANLGHTITKLSPSLFTFKIRAPILDGLPGTSFPATHLTLRVGEKTFDFRGPTLITHWGLSGPAVLKLSSFAARELHAADYRAQLTVNWLDSEKDAFGLLCTYRKSHPKRGVMSHSPFALTERFWKRLCELSSLSEELVYADLSNASVNELVRHLQNSELEISGKGEFKEEFVTCGGVLLSEINFKTMESKLVPHLYFAGEILDIDGITGGFNFQSAWTTGWHAGTAIAENASALD